MLITPFPWTGNWFYEHCSFPKLSMGGGGGGENASLSSSLPRSHHTRHSYPLVLFSDVKNWFDQTLWRFPFYSRKKSGNPSESCRTLSSPKWSHFRGGLPDNLKVLKSAKACRYKLIGIVNHTKSGSCCMFSSLFPPVETTFFAIKNTSFSA